MSFESTFNFTNALDALNAKISQEDQRIAANSAEITALQSTGGYANLAKQRIDMLTRLNVAAVQRKNEYLQTIQKINVVTNLPVEQKQNLLAVWQIVQSNGEKKDQFMAKMVSCYTDILAKAVAPACDCNLSADVKKSLVRAAMTGTFPTPDVHRLATRFDMDH